jgi:hypothetical protein
MFHLYRYTFSSSKESSRQLSVADVTVLQVVGQEECQWVTTYIINLAYAQLNKYIRKLGTPERR